MRKIILFSVFILLFITACTEDDFLASPSEENVFATSITVFTEAELAAAQDVLFYVWEAARDLSMSSNGRRGDGRVTIWLYPYHEDIIETFNVFLTEQSLNPHMFRFEPAVTDAMRNLRDERIARAVATMNDDSDLRVTNLFVAQQGIAFSVENTNAFEFFHGSPYDLAVYVDGAWRGVDFRPGAGGVSWTSEGRSYITQEVIEDHENWTWLFGTLPPGRYLFIREGHWFEWTPQWQPLSNFEEKIFTIAFEITADTPKALPARNAQ